MTSSKEKLKLKVIILSFVFNLFLFAIKFIISYLENSIALLGDAFHSLADVLITFIAFIGISLSKRKPTKNYPFGFSRFECVLSILISFVLFLTAFSILKNGLEQISNKTFNQSFSLSIIVTVVCIIIKEGLFLVTKKVGVKTSSTVLIADAYHHQADAFASVGALLGLIGARFNVYFAEGASCIIISLFIFKASISVFFDSVNKLVDKTANFSIEQFDELKSLPCVGVNVLFFRSRQFSSQVIVDIFIEFSIMANCEQTLQKLEKIKESILQNNPIIRELNFILKL